MLINFCNSGLVTKISSSACESEGYNVSNLISKVESERKKGFLVDYFIKPPVTIEFEFLSEVILSHIILWPQIGNQKTVGVELLTRNCDDKVFSSAGSAFMNGGEAGFLFFKHGDKKIEQMLVNRNFLIRSFKSIKFLRSKDLQVKILRTKGSSVPALQKVEIWGKLSRNSPKEIISKVMDIWNNVTKDEIARSSFNKEENINSNYDKLSLTVSNHDIESVSVNPSEFIIPDEFLDPISCEIMITPMILPSGKVVDNSTLERFIKEEAKWGRFPSDPFTGKLFMATSRPVISVALKTRIDKFLLDNCDEVYCKTLPRTVGGIPSVNQAKVSSLVSPVEAEKSSRISILRNENYGNFLSESYDDRIKKRKLSTSGDSSLSIEQNTTNYILEGKECQDPVRESRMQKSINLKKYDEVKKQSLECLLKSTLSSLPSFTTISNLDNDKIQCVKCNSVNVLYELPCKHHVCRCCLSFLIQSNSLKCTLCLKNFQTGDPKRTHIMNPVC